MKQQMRVAFSISLAMLFVPAAASAAVAGGPSSNPVIHRLSLGGPGGWDYLAVDVPHHRLFVSRGDRVMVVDLSTQKLEATMTGTDGVHGIAFAPEVHRGFTSNGRSASVTVFDLDSLKTVSTITGTGDSPDAILYDSASHHVLTFNGHGESVSVIDPQKNAVVDTIALPGKPEFAQADGAGHVYVNIEDKSELVELDSMHNTVLHSWPLAPCASPSGLALDRARHRLFSVCDNQLMAVTDASTGEVVATVPIGKGPDAVVFDAANEMIYISNGESGTLTVVHQDDADHYTVRATIPTQLGARTLALDPVHHRLYLPTASFETGKDTSGRPKMKSGSFVLLAVDQPY